MTKKVFLVIFKLAVFVLAFLPLKQNRLISPVLAEISISYTVQDSGGYPRPYLQPLGSIYWRTVITNNDPIAISGTLSATVEDLNYSQVSPGDWTVVNSTRLSYNYSLAPSGSQFASKTINWYATLKDNCPSSINSVKSEITNGVVTTQDMGYPLSRVYLTLQNRSGDSIRVYTYANGVLQYDAGTPLAINEDKRIEIWRGGVNGSWLFSCSDPFSYSFTVTGAAGTTYSCSADTGLSNNCVSEHTAICTKTTTAPTSTPTPSAPTPTPGNPLDSWLGLFTNKNTYTVGEVAQVQVCQKPKECFLRACFYDTIPVTIASGPSNVNATVCTTSGFKAEYDAIQGGSGGNTCDNCATTNNSANSGIDRNCIWNTTGWQAGTYVLSAYYGGHGDPGCSDSATTSNQVTVVLAAPTPTPTAGCSISINSGAACTNLLGVTLSGFPAGMTGMKFWNQGDAEPTVYEAFSSTKSWTINGWSSSNVWARFRNGGAYSGYCSDSILYPCATLTPTPPPALVCPTLAVTYANRGNNTYNENLTWNDIQNEDSYSIFKCTGEGCAMPGTPWTSVGAGVISITDTNDNNGYAAGLTVCYRVKPIRDGSGPTCSVVCVTNPMPTKTCTVLRSRTWIYETESITLSASGNGNDPVSEDVRLWVERVDKAQIPVPAGSSERIYGGIPYYLLGQCTSENFGNCNISKGLSNLPVGDYYLHCDVPDNDPPTMCTGNPFCAPPVGVTNGGINCAGDGWVSCSFSDYNTFSVLPVGVATPTNTPIPTSTPPIPTVTTPPSCPICPPVDQPTAVLKSGTTDKYIVNLAWIDVNDGVRQEDGYKIYRCLGASCAKPAVAITTSLANSVSYTDTNSNLGFLCGTVLSYWVSPTKSGCVEPICTQKTITLPACPGCIETCPVWGTESFTPADGFNPPTSSVTLRWSAPSSWGVVCPESERNNHYILYVSTTNDGPVSGVLKGASELLAGFPMVLDDSVTSYDLSGLTDGMTYYWQVQAENR